MNSELTIVIPAKNEERLIGRLLTSIWQQSYVKNHGFPKIILADADSWDLTVGKAKALSKAYKYDLTVVPGGLPAVGRNRGAQVATTRFVLFMDADIILHSPYVIEDAVMEARAHNRTLVTTDLYCPTGSASDRMIYRCANLCQRASGWFGMSFATGMFMLWNRDAFWRLGGFDEKALYAEDYMLSKKVPRKQFAVVGGGVATTNRRFKKTKMHGPKMVWLFIKTIFMGGNPEYFYKDQGYWH
jgi:glycosyltransferase involved in cell wall biosynthesis